jgi:acetyl esterase/lipase
MIKIIEPFGGKDMLMKVKFLICILMTGFCTLAAGCGSGTADTSTETKGSKNSGPDLVYKCPGMDKVEVKKDIVYKVDNDRKLKMDIYYPLGIKDASKNHTVILVHGSGPVESFKDTDVYMSWGRAVASKGFTAVTFNWRPNVSTNDVSDLMKYVRDNAEELKINGNSITVFAFSAGVKEGIKEAALSNTGYLKSIVVYYGELDSSILSTAFASGLPPMFIAMGALDYTIPASSNDKFISDFKASGGKVTYMAHSKGGHGFDVLNDDKETYDIIEKTLQFIKDNSGK